MSALNRKVKLEDLPEALLAVLAAGPREIREIAAELGYSTRAVLSRLEQLQIEQRAHRRRVQIKTWAGVCYHWYLGPALDTPAGLEGGPARQSVAQQGTIPFQSTVRTYPAINRRDPLVAALFGQPGIGG